MESLKPLLDDNALERSKAIAERFARKGAGPRRLGPGEYLQSLLIEWDKQQHNSWLEKWWLEMAYHSWREPMCVNSNYWILFANDPNAYDTISKSSHQQQESPKGVDGVGYSEFQVRRAARIINAALSQKETIQNKQWPVEVGRDGPLCMYQYDVIFGVTRIPKPGCDEIKIASKPSRHIVVMVDDQLFRINAYDKQMVRYGLGDIEDQLSAVIKYVKSLSNKQKSPPVGVLSGGHRDRWASVYSELLLSPKNKQVLDQINDASFVLSLDDTITLPYGSVTAAQQTPKHHATRPGHNRWFDKVVSIVVDRNGVAGACGEHSPCDALIPAYIYNNIGKILLEPENRIVKGVPRDRLSSVAKEFQPKKSHLKFENINDGILDKIQEAEREISKIARESISLQLQFDMYGSDWIKRVAHTSPDAFVQMALQLAYFRTHGTFPPTYETASSRQFFHGRTETIRSLSAQSANFVQGIDSAELSNKAKYDLLTTAAKAHTKQTILSSTGKGIDRHLLGLKLAYYKLDPKDGKSPLDEEAKQAIEDFFNDKAFSESSTWKLSTSGLFPAQYLVHTGFGCVSPHCGYGINYMIKNSSVNFGIEGKLPSVGHGTNVPIFKENIKKALVDMQTICESASAETGNLENMMSKL
ncbi:hypothetical protein H4219_000662 [Mycoemilia scoparia]|uniref:Choline/carnitine acyltransferase domain-containing protein n=1 Tax=Mycoemilia scoparia TaxID=417184 RepID=A0A9W8DWN1_9FUNG|nr:hypothetical protein H4219_000662 [Mycoemilia scoparia]